MRAWAVALASMAAVAAAAEVGVWSALRHPMRAAADITVAEDGTVSLRGEGALGVVHRDAPPDLRRLAWRWRVAAAPATARHHVRGADDRAVAVHVWFDDGDDAADDRYGPLLRMLGYPRVTHALTYVWGGDRAVETVIVSPYHARGRLIVLRRDGAPLNTWLEETRDVAADARAAFGAAAPRTPPRWLAVSTDGDDTGVATAADVAALRALDP